MFRRLDSGLPKDPVYPTTFEGLGYYINENDEIRNIENPKAYFKFFLTRNDRYNCLQRESMNEAIRNEINTRLEQYSLQKIPVPLGATPKEPHLPIFVSANLSSFKRVIILFYETNQDLGVFAHRIIGGPGGITAGSAVCLVQHIQSLPSPPGIILANMGQLRWWRRGRKAVTQTTWYALPQASAVDPNFAFDEVKNTIPGNRTAAEHVAYIFEKVVPALCAPDAKLDVIGVAEGAREAAIYMDKNFGKLEGRLEAYAGLSSYFHASEIANPDFATWLKHRGRVYLVSHAPSGTFMAGHEGTKRIEAHGCPVFSLGEPYYSETMLPKGHKTVVNWFEEVAAHPGYSNPGFFRYGDDEDSGSEAEYEYEEPGIDFSAKQVIDEEAAEVEDDSEIL